MDSRLAQPEQATQADKPAHHAGDDSSAPLETGQASNIPRDLDSILAIDPDIDLDQHRNQLKERFDAGDGTAAWELHQIARYCNGSIHWIRIWQNALGEAIDPERRIELREEIDRFEAIQGQCRNSELADQDTLTKSYNRWQWEAADAGVEEAMVSLAFSPQAIGPGYEAVSDEPTISDMAQRQRRYAEELRARCHVEALQTMGEGFAEDDPFVRGMEYSDHPGVDSDTARHMEAFTHRYAAASKQGESNPARYARSPDHVLTASEEMKALELAESMVSECNTP
ncbi:hypothetical protein J2T60_002340 [Natronospira proteinivora]|uniref:Uncharacterized protein n=1 Tax=Natronospira proteinivora TaxID=1807133 RepID=A0ABT1GAJ7_9GAMM|nr:hypothetical protein [Natronospira proteinivora]MCP1728340.1 hypothetical protein [Natronospira proteinivora]